MEVVCGVDVSKGTLDIAVQVGGKFRSAQFGNDEEGFSQLLDWARALGANLFSMEATGPYHKALRRFLEVRGLRVLCLSPYRMRRLAEGLGILDKDDELDAKVLCLAAQMSGARSPDSRDPLRERLLEISRRVDQLVRAIARERTRLKEPRLSTEVEDSLRRSIQWHVSELEALRKTWMQLALGDEKLSKDLKLALSAPHIGPKTALTLLSELPQNIRSSKGISALAGMAPRRRRSGTSLNAPDRIGRACNPKLKRCLYMPALQALKTSPELREYYLRLVANGKHPKQAHVAVMHKLLRRVVAVLERQTPWQTTPPAT